MKLLLCKEWWARAGVRALKTVAQTAVGVIGSSLMITDVDWRVVLSASLLAGFLSLLTSIGGIPEVSDNNLADG